MHPPVAVGVVGVGEHLPDQQPQLGPAGVRRRARPAAPFIEPGGGHHHPLAHLHDRVQCRYSAFSASMNSYLLLTDTPGRRRPPLFPRTPSSSATRGLLVPVHAAEPTRLLSISYAVFCLTKKKTTQNRTSPR